MQESEEEKEKAVKMECAHHAHVCTQQGTYVCKVIFSAQEGLKRDESEEKFTKILSSLKIILIIIVEIIVSH